MYKKDREVFNRKILKTGKSIIAKEKSMNLKELLGDSFKEGMTVEEINDALSGVKMPVDKSEEVEKKYKELISKANSEASKYKKELNDKLSEDEKKAKADEEARTKLETDYNNLLKEVTISKYKAKFLEVGYDSTLAEESSNALFNGDSEKLFETLKRNNEALEKKFKAEKMDSTPKPRGGNSANPTITAEQFSKMSYKEMVALANDNPELYAELTKD